MPKIIEPVLTPQDAEWGRQVNARQLETEAAQARALQDQTATNKANAASLDAISRQINAMPLLAADGATVAPISASSTDFTTVASTSIPVPTGKVRANFTLVGSVGLLDTVSGGIAAPPDARFLVDGVPYPRGNGIPATKDAGASAVNNVSTVGAAGAYQLAGQTSISVELQVRVFHATAYATASPSNFATFGAQVVFS